MVVVRGFKTWCACKIQKPKSSTLWISVAVFISVIVYLPTLQFATISFFLKNARASCIFYIYLAKPLCKLQPVKHWLSSRYSFALKNGEIKLAKKLGHAQKIICKVYLLRCQSVAYDFVDTKYNEPRISVRSEKLTRSTFHQLLVYFLKNDDKQKLIQFCK